jgi:hypothetical protein
MLILSWPASRVQVECAEGELQFPADVALEVRMSPPEVFGLAPLQPSTGIVMIGTQPRFERTNYRGPGRIVPTGTLEVTNFDSTFIGVPFVVEGNIARFNFRVAALAGLDQFVWHVDAKFTQFFSCAMPTAVEIEEISGTIGGYPFAVHSSLTSSNTLYASTGSLSPELKAHFDGVAASGVGMKLEMVAALRYLQQSERLQMAGHHVPTFLSERILNLAKALDSLFPDGVDQMRAELATQQVANDYIEVLASVSYLRSQVDVAHVSFTPLAEGQVQEVENFVTLASACLRALLNTLTHSREAQERIAAFRTSRQTPRAHVTLALLRKHVGLQYPAADDLSVARRSAPTQGPSE